jgi:hypothetical protein
VYITFPNLTEIKAQKPALLVLLLPRILFIVANGSPNSGTLRSINFVFPGKLPSAASIHPQATNGRYRPAKQAFACNFLRAFCRGLVRMTAA